MPGSSLPQADHYPVENLWKKGPCNIMVYQSRIITLFKNKVVLVDNIQNYGFKLINFIIAVGSVKQHIKLLGNDC